MYALRITVGEQISARSATTLRLGVNINDVKLDLLSHWVR